MNSYDVISLAIYFLENIRYSIWISKLFANASSQNYLPEKVVTKTWL